MAPQFLFCVTLRRCILNADAALDGMAEFLRTDPLEVLHLVAAKGCGQLRYEFLGSSHGLVRHRVDLYAWIGAREGLRLSPGVCR